jgi:phage terminase large subunit-like protein
MAAINGQKRATGGWNRKTLEQHIADGTYRADRHGPLAPSVLDYPKPPLKVRASIKSQRRWFRNLHDELAFRDGCRFNERLAEHAAAFFPKYLRHSKGEWRGKAFELLPWQRDDLIYPLFGWVRADGTRRFRRVFVEIPKKNGKSTLASGIGLYMLCADCEGGAEIYSAAADKDQAGIVHGEAIRMAEASEELSRCLKINKSTHNIGYHATASWYRALSNEPGGKEGLNIHACIIDELHVWRGRDLWDTLRYGYRSRRQPLQFVITTAGDDDQSVCYSELQRARQVLAGEIRDDAFLPLIYEAAPEDDWTSEDVWRKANPSLGSTFAAESLREDVAAAKGRAAEESTFKRYSLNIWQRASNQWLSPDAWAANRREFSGTDMLGCPCYGGLDLSRTSDMTALALVFPWEENGRPVFRQLVRFWLPEQAQEKYRHKINIPAWLASGCLELMGDDYGPVEAAIAEAAAQFDLAGIAYDRMYARDFAKQLGDEHGIVCVEFAQTITQYAGPTAEYERMLLNEALHHNGNPVLTWQAGHVHVKTDANANKRPVKPPHGDHRKIDGIVSGIMALEYAMRMQAEGVSAYDTPDAVFNVDDLMEQQTESPTEEEAWETQEEYATDDGTYV